MDNCNTDDRCNIDKDSNDVKIRSLNPPFVPARPTDPDRLLLNALVLFGSVAVGTAIAFFLSLLHPVFYNRRSLEHLTQIPVLGAVTLSHKPADRVSSLMKHLNFSILAVLLPVMCAGLLYLQLKNDDLYESLKFTGDDKTRIVALTPSN